MSKVENNKNWFQRHTVITTIAATILFFIILFAILGGGGETSDTSTGGSQSTSQQSGSQTTETKNEYKITEPASLDGYTVTVDSVQRNYIANEYLTPESGKEFVAVTVTITNTRDSEGSYNTYNFEVEDSNGVRQTEAYAGNEGGLNSGSLAPGGTVSGILTYEVPAGDSGLKLIYKPNMFSDKNITVNLGE